MKHNKILFFFLTLILSVTTLGNNRFKQLSINEGLSHSDVLCLTQDSTGLIWIGSYAGLQSYDGYSLKHYDFYTDSTKIYQSHNRIHAVACTKEHLWIGTESGLTCFDLKTRQYIPYTITGKGEGLNNDITNLCFNPSDSLLLIKTYRNILLAKIKSNHIQILQWNSDEERIQCKNMKKFHFYNNKIHGSGNFDTIFVIDKKKDKATISTSLSLNKLLNKKDIKIKDYASKGHYLYIRTEAGCYRVKIENGTPIPSSLLYINFLNTDLSFTTNYSFTVFSSGDLWCCGKNGITEIRKPYSSNPTFHRYLDSPLSNDVSLLRTTDILIDKFNNLWLSSTSKGIFYRNLNESFFQTLSNEDFRKLGLSQNEIVSVCKHPDGTIWMIVEYGSLFTYNKELDKLEKIQISKEDNILFQYIYIDKESNIYIGSNAGLYIYNTLEKKLHKLNTQSDLDNASISYIINDKKGIMWIATWRKGIYCINKTNNKYLIREHLSTKTDPALVSDDINSIERKGDYIFLCTKNGLQRIRTGKDGKIKNVSLYQTASNKKYSMTSDYIVAIDCENDSTCWLGTIGGGINRLVIHSENNNDYTAKTYTTKNGLPSNDCEIIMLDNENNLWIGCNTLSFLNTKNEHIEVFNDMPQNKAFKVGVSCKDDNGHYYMGGLYGLTTFNPYIPHLQESKHKPYFMDLTVNNQSIKPQSKYEDNCVLKYSLQYTDKIRLNHRQNNFSVTFSALNYGSTSQSTFRYRLKNYNDKWILLPSGQNNAYFTDLPYGTYTLEIQHSLDKGYTWDSPIKQLKIQILPPWWWTSWMKAIYTLLLITIFVYSLKHYIKEQSLMKENELQKILIEKDEERYQSKIRFFMNISHELKTPLTLILLSIEKIIKENTDNKEHKTILSQTKRMLSLISELVDFRKTELGISKIYLTSINISQITQNLLDEILPWIEHKQLSLKYEFDQDSIIMDADYEKIYKLITNLISNAIKYTNNGGELYVSLHRNKMNIIQPYFQTSYTEGKVDKETESCTIIIRDNGIGISSESIKMIYERFFQIKEQANDNHLGSGLGLAIVKNIVLQHNGMITISSERGKGTEFIVTLPIKNNCKGKIINTEHLNLKTFIQENYNELPTIEESGAKAEKDKDNQEKQCILIVEDNQDLREMLKEHFASDYIIRTAANGKEGLNMCLSYFPDIIISDVMMPEMDGIEMCRRIKNNLSIAYTPIILLTAKDNVESQIEGYESGADLYIPKPFSTKLLEVNLKRLLSIHEQNMKGIKKGPATLPEEESKRTNDSNENDAPELSLSEKIETKEQEIIIEKIKKIIEENISDANLSPDFIASKLGISRSNLYRKIKRIDGMSFADYVRNYRLEKATYLLTHTSYTIQEIVYEIGFINASHFSKIFKLKYNISPLEYKQKGHNKKM